MHARQQALVLSSLALFLLPGLAPAKTPSKLQGKVFLTKDRVKDQEPSALTKLFLSRAPKGELARDKDKHWKATLVSFFKKDSIPGPITIWIYDKSDKEALKNNEPTQILSATSSPSTHFIYNIDFDPDVGFNKERSYLIRVGQIIQKRQKIYATGEITLGK